MVLLLGHLPRIGGIVPTNQRDKATACNDNTNHGKRDGRESDTSFAGVTILSGSLTKEVYAINGSTTLPIGTNGKVIVQSGDVVTYRIQ